MAKGPGGFVSGGFDPLNAPDAPTEATGVPSGLGGATISVTAPEDTGGGSVTEYRFQIVDTSDDSDQSETSETTSKELSISGGTYKVRAVAFNEFGPSVPSAYSSNFAVFTSREIYAAGSSNYGQFDTTTFGAVGSNRSSPVQINSDYTIDRVDGGLGCMTIITSDNKYFAVGGGFYGRLGDNTNIDRSSPVQIGALTNWKRVTVGQNSTNAVKTDGTLWGWGLGSNAGLSIGGFGRSSPIQLGAFKDWVVTQNGYLYGGAIATDGTLYMWGNNTYGQLGTGDDTESTSPKQVGGETHWNTDESDTILRKFDAQFYATGATTSDDTLYVWGLNQYGQLGDNSVTLRSSPVQLATNVSTFNFFKYTGQGLVYITNDGKLFSCGRNDNGELGHNNTITRSSPVQVGALTDWKYIATSTGSCWAIKTDGTLWAWGLNTNGQLGLGTAANVSSPTQVGSDTNWAEVYLGVYNSSGMLAGKLV